MTGSGSRNAPGFTSCLPGLRIGIVAAHPDSTHATVPQTGPRNQAMAGLFMT